MLAGLISCLCCLASMPSPWSNRIVCLQRGSHSDSADLSIGRWRMGESREAGECDGGRMGKRNVGVGFPFHWLLYCIRKCWIRMCRNAV